MTEWGVVGVIVVLVGLVGSIIKPLLSLNSSIVTLTTKMEHVSDNLSEINERNRKSHERIWAHNEEQDATISNHESRIKILEIDKEKRL